MALLKFQSHLNFGHSDRVEIADVKVKIILIQGKVSRFKNRVYDGTKDVSRDRRVVDSNLDGLKTKYEQHTFTKK